MPKYVPLDAGIRFDWTLSSLLDLHWEVYGFSAEFTLPDDDANAIKVAFVGRTIVRVLDDAPFSGGDAWEGLAPTSFAYRVEGASFAAAQKVDWGSSEEAFFHYRLLSGQGCIDVLYAGEPMFRFTPNES